MHTGRSASLKFTVSSAIRLLVLIYIRTLESAHLEEDDVFDSNMKDTELQFQEPDATLIPVTFLLIVSQKIEIIESRAE